VAWKGLVAEDDDGKLVFQTLPCKCIGSVEVLEAIVSVQDRASWLGLKILWRRFLDQANKLER
jgi:hypothetical protein